MYVADGDDVHDHALNQMYYRVLCNACSHLRELFRSNPSVEASFDKTLGKKRRILQQQEQQQQEGGATGNDVSFDVGDDGCASIWALELEMAWRRRFIDTVNATPSGGVFVPRAVTIVDQEALLRKGIDSRDEDGGTTTQSQKEADAAAPNARLHAAKPFDTAKSYETILSNRILVPLSATVFGALGSAFAAADVAPSASEAEAVRKKRDRAVDVDQEPQGEEKEEEGSEKQKKKHRKDKKDKKKSEADEQVAEEDSEHLSVIKDEDSDGGETTATRNSSTIGRTCCKAKSAFQQQQQKVVAMDVPSRRQQQRAFLQCSTPLALINARQWTMGNLMPPMQTSAASPASSASAAATSHHFHSDVLAAAKRRADAAMLEHAVRHGKWYAPLFAARLDGGDPHNEPHQQDARQSSDDNNKASSSSSSSVLQPADPDHVMHLVSSLSQRRGLLLRDYYNSARRVLDLKLKQHLRALHHQNQQDTQDEEKEPGRGKATGRLNVREHDMAGVTRSYLLLQRHTLDGYRQAGVDVSAAAATATLSSSQKNELGEANALQHDPVLRTAARLDNAGAAAKRRMMNVDSDAYLRGVGAARARGSAGEERETLWIYEEEEEKETEEEKDELAELDPDVAPYLWPQGQQGEEKEEAQGSFAGGFSCVASASTFCLKGAPTTTARAATGNRRNNNNNASIPLVLNHGILRVGKEEAEFPFTRLVIL